MLQIQITQLIDRFSQYVTTNVFYNKYFELSSNILDIYDYDHSISRKDDSLYKILEIAIVNNKYFTLAHSHPDEHQILTHFKHPLFKNHNEIKEQVWHIEDHILYLKKAVVYDGDIIGFVFINIDTSPLNKELNDLLTNFLILSILLLPFVLLSTTLFAKWLEKPLLEIIVDLKNLGKGNLQFPLASKRKDEFSILSKALITADKRIFNQQQHLLDNQKLLESRINERTHELQDSADELAKTISQLQQSQKQLVESEKMSSLGSLVAGVAHEINTPIGISLTGSSHIHIETDKMIASIESDGLTKSALTSYLTMVKEMSQSMNLSLENAASLVKSFKQVAVDQHTENKRNFNLKSYCDDIILSLHVKLRHKNITINNLIDQEITIYSYAGIFSQILTNFIINSLLHGFDNLDNEQEKNIQLQASVLKDKSLLFTYEDDGHGINEETLQKVFDPFFTTKLGKGGSGLGLNIIYNLIVHKLNGEITCQSQINKGVKMLITIPQSELIQ